MKDKIYSVLPHLVFVIIFIASGYLIMSASAGIPIFILASSLVIYLWSRELLGKWWALLPPFLFGFSPIIPAMDPYFTVSTATVFGFILALYLFTKFLSSRTNRHLLWAGIGLGIALSINAYDIILIPIYLIILIFFWFGETARMKIPGTKRFFGFIGDFVLILIVALALTYIAYLIPVFNFSYPISQYFSDVSNAVHGLGSGIRIYSLIKYFPKNMLPISILSVLSFCFGAKSILSKFKGGKLADKFLEYLGTNFAEFSLFAMTIIYSAYIIKYSSGGGLENFLPILPFVYILTASGLKNWISRNRLFQ